MSTVGYVFILVAILLIRQVSRGRVMNLGEDLSDAFTAVVSGDTDALGAVLTRTGDSNTPSAAAETDGKNDGSTGGIGSRNTGGLLAAAITRGNKAKGYRWTATGPDYYDCSGLVWRACQDIGFTGSRFVTATVASARGMERVAPPNAEGPGLKRAGVGDIVVWPGHHMGVVSGPNQFYSARNVRVGIGYAPIGGFRKEAPIYLRFTQTTVATKGL